MQQRCHSYVAITGHWISSDWELLSAVLAVSISNVSHTAEEIAALVQELGIKYTLDDRLDVGCVTGYQVIRVIRIFAKTYPFE